MAKVTVQVTIEFGSLQNDPRELLESHAIRLIQDELRHNSATNIRVLAVDNTDAL